MAIMEVFDKNHELVVKNTQDAHQQYCDGIEKAIEEQGMTITELGIAADAGPAATYRMKDVTENITLTTMQRFAAAAGLKVNISFEPLHLEED